MRIIIAAVGRLKDGAERDLIDRYIGRLEATGRPLAIGPVQVLEQVEGRAGDVDARKADEADRLLKSVSAADQRVVLDAGGKMVSSEAFAEWLRAVRDGGTRTLAFLIGGPDGHGSGVLAAANLRLSLGPMTLPHGLARIVLAEQLYRAATIISGHPYHRA